MAFFVKPTSHLGRYIFLVKAAATGQMDIDAGRIYIPQTLVNLVLTFLPSYKTLIDALLPFQAAFSKETREKNEALVLLQWHVLDVWEVLRRRVRRRGEPKEVLTFYGLPLDGKNPSFNSEIDWINAAQTIIDGDAAAVLASHDAMTNPSAADVQTALDSFKTEAAEVPPADRNLDLALAAAEAQVPAAGALIDDVMAELRHTHRKLSFPSQRRIMRTYGARFYFEKGEPNEGFHSEVFANGDGTATVFSYTVVNPPVTPGTVDLTDGVEIFTDTNNGDGTGTLTGSNGGTGSVTYATGILTLTFNTAPVSGSEVKVEYLEML